MLQHVVSRRSARVASIHAESLVMICAPTAKRSSFRDGRQSAERLVSAARTAQMITSLPKGGAKSLSFWREEPRRGRPEGERSMSLRDGPHRLADHLILLCFQCFTLLLCGILTNSR